METLEKITISLSAEMLAEVKTAVDKGEFTDTSEVVRAALRQWQRTRNVIALPDDKLHHLVAEGRESDAAIDGDVAIERLRAKYSAMSAK
jgi:antitoxin ParD1/3/4